LLPIAGSQILSDLAAFDQYALTPAQGLNVTGRCTNKNKTGITFIVLEAEADGQEFRQVLDEAMKNVAK
jgi:hypothetical protein